MENSMQSSKLIKSFEKIKTYLDRMENFGFSGTALLAQGSEVLLHKGYGFQDYQKKRKMDKEAVLSIGSIAKQFTSTIILSLEEQGKIKVSDTLDRFFDHVPEDKAEITIHQLLTHTAGLGDASGDDFEEISTEDVLEVIFNQELQTEPGTTFSYSNIGYTLAAIIAEKVSHQSYVTLLRHLYTDLGITTASWFGDPIYNDNNSVSYYVEGKRTGSVYEWPGSHDVNHPYWHILGNGGVCINQQDMYTYLKALFSGQIITDESLVQMLTPEQNDYGYGWDIIDDTPLGTLIRHDGGSSEGVSATVRYYRDQDIYLMISSNTIINSFGTAFIVEEIVEKILYGMDIVMPPDIEIDTTTTSQLDGEYTLQGKTGSIKIENLEYGPLLLHINGQKTLDVFFSMDTVTQARYEKMNQIITAFGEAVLEENWEKAFSFAERKSDYERRANLLSRLKEMARERHGAISHIEVGGTIPHPEFESMSMLFFVCEDGYKAGLPIFWNNSDEFLGFRPMIAQHTISLFATYSNGSVFGYSPLLDSILKMRVDSSQRIVSVVENNL